MHDGAARKNLHNHRNIGIFIPCIIKHDGMKTPLNMPRPVEHFPLLITLPIANLLQHLSLELPPPSPTHTPDPPSVLPSPSFTCKPCSPACAAFFSNREALLFHSLPCCSAAPSSALSLAQPSLVLLVLLQLPSIVLVQFLNVLFILLRPHPPRPRAVPQRLPPPCSSPHPSRPPPPPRAALPRPPTPAPVQLSSATCAAFLLDRKQRPRFRVLLPLLRFDVHARRRCVCFTAATKHFLRLLP